MVNVRRAKLERSLAVEDNSSVGGRAIVAWHWSERGGGRLECCSLLSRSLRTSPSIGLHTTLSIMEILRRVILQRSAVLVADPVTRTGRVTSDLSDRICLIIPTSTRTIKTILCSIQYQTPRSFRQQLYTLSESRMLP